MSFYSRYEPKCFDDLVFDSPEVAKTIGRYTTGLKTKHLLLHGPPGSGKSAAARVIVNTCVPNLANTRYNEPIDMQVLDSKGLECVGPVWSTHTFNGAARGYAIIDEVDKLKPGILNQLHTATECHTVGTYICTTNNLHKLDHALVNRFSMLEMNLPSPDDWLPRAQDIMAREGFNLSRDHVRTLLGNKNLSARRMLEMLEDGIHELNEMATE